MHRRRLITTALCLAALGPAAGVARASDCPGTDVQASVATVQQVSDAMICLLNQQRAAAGRSALTADPQLQAMALDYAGDMAAGHFFAHVSPTGETLQDRLDAVGYHFDAAGENLAWAGAGATAAQIVDAWMASSGHRENILDPDFHQIGVGFALTAATTTAGPEVAFVNEFGTPTAAARTATTTRSVSAAHRRAARARRRAHAAQARRHRARRHHRRHLGAVVAA